MKNSVLYTIMVFLFVSCKVNTDDYVSYLIDSENGLNIIQSVAAGTYQMKFRPVDLMIANEKTNSSQSISELKKSFGDLEYYLLEVKKHKPEKSEKASFYYAYQFENDIYRIENQDTIRPSLYHLDQGINGSAHIRINLAFPPTDVDRHIVVSDKYGPKVSFDFLEKNVDNLPKISM